ncbi:MAG: OmpA family protein [Granulosicoccus sp.]|nr:OmpA family protein [Granulosicoccus sp.]
MRLPIRKAQAIAHTISLVVTSAALLAGAAIPGLHAQEMRDADFSKRVYVTGGLGLTRVEPESPSDALTISDNSDTGAHLGLGYDLNRMLSVEVYVADLGTAEVEFLGTAAGSVDYQVFGLSLLGYLVNSRSGFVLADSQPEGLFRREGLSVYARVGIGHMENDADRVDYFRDYPTHAAFGLGLEYGFRNGFALRTELMSLDTDAQYANVGILKRFGDVPAVPLIPPIQPALPVPAADKTAIEPAVPESPVSIEPIVSPVPHFEFDKSDLNEEDMRKLDIFAESMRDRESEIVIEGHTDWIASESYNMSLSIRRAEAVYNYLASKGMSPSRMTTMGYGETRPISNNNTSAGRALNRRVEIKIR